MLYMSPVNGECLYNTIYIDYRFSYFYKCSQIGKKTINNYFKTINFYFNYH